MIQPAKCTRIGVPILALHLVNRAFATIFKFFLTLLIQAFHFCLSLRLGHHLITGLYLILFTQLML